MDRLNEIKELWVEKIPFEAFWHEIEELRKETDAEGYRRGVEEAAKESDIMREPMISWHIRRLLQRGTGGGE